MIRVVLLAFLAALAGGCISSDDPANGAVRVLNAVPDAPPMNIYFNGGLQATLDYRVGSRFLVAAAGQYPLKIEELLPSGADPAVNRIFDQATSLSVNEELTLVVLGEAASGAEEVVPITATTRGVPTGKTRVQVVHAGVGGDPVDVYVTEVPPQFSNNEDVVLTGSAPFAPALAYKAYTPQSDITGGYARIVVTAVGAPSAVLLESPTLFLPAEGTILVAVVKNTGLDNDQHPFTLVLAAGGGSSAVVDKDAPASLRIANASPGSYTLDTFVNATSITSTADTPRQTCGSPPTGVETVIEECGRAYGYVAPAFATLTAGGYEFKVQRSDAQQSDPSQPTAKSFPLTLAATAAVTSLITGLVSDTATTTDVTLVGVPATRHIATETQLLLANAAVEGGEINGLDLSITPVDATCNSLATDAWPAYSVAGILQGFSTGYRAYLGGTNGQFYYYQIKLTDPGAADQVLLNKRLAATANEVYTLAIAGRFGDATPPDPPFSLELLPLYDGVLDDSPQIADCTS